MLSAIAFIISKSWTVCLKSINYEQNKEYREEDFILAISHLISFTWATTYHVSRSRYVSRIRVWTSKNNTLVYNNFIGHCV